MRRELAVLDAFTLVVFALAPVFFAELAAATVWCFFFGFAGVAASDSTPSAETTRAAKINLFTALIL